MTTLRPERPADGPMSYEDTGQFAAVVQRLSDPLNDPLPDRPPAVRDEHPAAVRDAYEAVVPESYEAAPSAVPPEPPFYDRPLTTDEPSAPPAASPWFRSPGLGPEAPQVRAAGPRPELFTPPPEPIAPEAFVRSDQRQEQRLTRRPEQRPEQPGFARPGPAAFVPPETVEPAAFVPTESVPTEPVQRPVRPEQPVRQPAQPGRQPARPARAVRPEVTETAQLPVITPGAPESGGPDPLLEPAAEPSQAPFDEDGPQLAGADSAPSVAPPPEGGRAARRKAAGGRQGGGGHRARGRTAGTATGSPAEPSAPLSRVEARRAAKAAKDSPSVVISRIVGELFITVGLIMLLFVTYQLWWTNVRAHQQANSASNKLEHQWDSAQADPSRAAGTFSPGQGFAIMYIPKLDVKAPIAQGVDKSSVLDKGMVGHYDGSLNTGMPWDKTGNFAVAAHRNTHGEPFRYVNRLVPGDKVVVETQTTYYTYTITSSLASTPPSNVSVLQPIPPGSGFTTAGRYLTLTTCTPEFTSTNRLIVWGKLTEERPRSKGKPDALVGG